jgi:hypothetical protein
MAWFMLAGTLWASSPQQTIKTIAHHIAHPQKMLGELNVMGSASKDEARILLLPEIHDDAHSLLMQLVLIAQEKKRGDRLVFLGESIPALTKSPWELFSQKALSIIAAGELKGPYVPKDFEHKLKNTATKLAHIPGLLNWHDQAAMWVVNKFAHNSSYVYGWDRKEKASLIDRNNTLIASLEKALKSADRVIVMLGARHVPELEYLSSLKLLCPSQKPHNIKDFFATIKKHHGIRPMLPHGIGATLTLYDFLSQHKYAVLFNKNLYQALDKAVKIPTKCVNIKE